MERALRNQGVVILFSEIASRVQPARDDTYRLELRSRIANGLFVYCKCLGEILVCDFLESVLICDLPASDEETKRKVRRARHAGIESRERAVHEFVECRGL